MRVILVALSVVFGQGLALAATNQPSFYDRRDYPTIYYESVVPGDVNGDGITDLISGNYTHGIGVQFGNGDGTFRPGPSSVTAQDLGPMEMVPVDVNGDGKLDLVMSTASARLPFPYGIAVSLGNGDGTFNPWVFYQAGEASFIIHLTVADFDGDHVPDAAILSPSGVWFYKGHSDGTFSSPVLTSLANETDSYSYKLASADINGDGKLDIVALTSNGYAVLLGNGKGAFSATEYTTPAIPYDVAIGDLNGDGRPDLAMVGPYFPDGGNDAYILLGNGNGTFGPPSLTYLPSQRIIRIGDLNNDGKLDLVGGFGFVAYGNGKGKFGQPIFLPIAAPMNTGLGADYVALADLQGDGSLDIVTANQGSTLTVLLNRGNGNFYDGMYLTMPTGVYCAVTGDFNGDGKIDVILDGVNEDFVLFGTGKAKQPFTQGPTVPLTGGCPAVADVNGDGILDLVASSGIGPTKGTVTTYLGNGDGTFHKSAVLGVNVNPGTALLADFNGDGKLDVALSGNLIVYGNGDGTFGNPAPIVTLPQFGSFTSFATADLNGDGRPDMVSSDTFNGAAYVVLNQGNGVFTVSVFSVYSFCTGAPFVSVADLNFDGHPDFVYGCALGYVDTYLGNGDGTFREAPLITLPFGEGGPVVLADFNGDGIPDIGAAANNTFGIYLGNGDGTFQTDNVRWFGQGPEPQLPIAVNLHGQSPAAGLADILIPDATGLVGIYLNTTRH